MRFAVVVLAALVLGPAAAAKPWIVRADAKAQYLGDLRFRDAATFKDVIDVFGPPDDCTMRSWFSMAVWRTPGFRMRVTTLGGLTPGKTFCTDPPHVHIDSAIVTGKRWHTPSGLYVGDTFAKFRRLYPQSRRFRQGWGIAMVYRRCVIGICPRPYDWAPRLVASFRDGRIVSFVFPIGAQGE